MNYDLTYVPVHVMFKKVVLEVIDLAVPSLFKFPDREKRGLPAGAHLSELQSCRFLLTTFVCHIVLSVYGRIIVTSL